MAELTEVLGTILKDVTKSRVTSDLFSRDVSLEYASDPILIEFPVPRVEIKEAMVDLNFAVNGVQRRVIDRDAVIEKATAELNVSIGRRIATALVEEHPNRDELQRFLKESQVALDSLIAEVSQGVTAESPNDVVNASNGQPAVLVRKLGNTIEKTLRARDNIWEVLKKGLRVGEIQERIQKNCARSVDEFAKNVQDATRGSVSDALGIDVAVSRDELANVSDSVLSQIKIVTEIRNYEWNEVGDIDGEPVRRLQPV